MPKTASLRAESAENVIVESAAPIPEKADNEEAAANDEIAIDSAMPKSSTDRSNLNEEEKEGQEEKEPPAVGLTQ